MSEMQKVSEVKLFKLLPACSPSKVILKNGFLIFQVSLFSPGGGPFIYPILPYILGV
jgi:hypothetical protein